jgi:hypothetical protein
MHHNVLLQPSGEDEEEFLGQARIGQAWHGPSSDYTVTVRDRRSRCSVISALDYHVAKAVCSFCVFSLGEGRATVMFSSRYGSMVTVL